MPKQPGPEFMIHVRGLLDQVPVAVRLRRWLKSAKRGYGLVVEDYYEVPTPDPAPERATTARGQ